MSDVARSSLIVNLLTEDNLPSYHHEIATLFGRDGRLGRLGAPLDRRGGPARHRDPRLPADVSRAVDPVQLERLRMDHMSTGYTRAARRHDPLAGLRLVPGAGHPGLAPQHRQDHRRRRSPTSCWPGSRPTRTCTWSSTATCSAPRSSSTPNQTMRAITDVVTNFAMPGTDIAGFQRKAVEMAIAGVYDIRQHRDDVVAPVLRFWNVFEHRGPRRRGRAGPHRARRLHGRAREAGAALRGQARRPQGPDGRPRQG